MNTFPADPRHPSAAFLRSLNIHALLPQRVPFVMVGQLTAFEMSHLESTFTIPADNLFVDHGEFSAAGMIENVAQTCAARIGYVNVYILKKKVAPGVIGATRNLKVEALAGVGHTLHTTVEIKEEVFGMMLIAAAIRCEGRLLLTTETMIATIEREE